MREMIARTLSVAATDIKVNAQRENGVIFSILDDCNKLERRA